MAITVDIFTDRMVVKFFIR